MFDRVIKLHNRFRNWMLDTRAAVELSRMGLGYMPWSAAALRPAAVAGLVNEVIVNNRRTVVEFGCGVSTLYLAKVLSGCGGRLVTFEDNAEWAAIVEGLLKAEGLDGHATIIRAPLAACRYGQGGLQWYDETAVAAGLAGLSVDLVIVDGPVASVPGLELARYPAMPMVMPHLAERCAVALDDINRRGEQAVVEAWKRLPGFDMQVTVSHAGYAISARGHRFSADL
jgi:Methyltransferase domain